MARRSHGPQRWQNRCRHCLPTDALISFFIRCRLCHLVPVRLHIDTIAHLRIGPIPQRRPACWCDTRWLCIYPDVFQYLADVSTVCDEGNDSHLPATEGTQERKHLINAGDQHRP